MTVTEMNIDATIKVNTNQIIKNLRPFLKTYYRRFLQKYGDVPSEASIELVDGIIKIEIS